MKLACVGALLFLALNGAIASRTLQQLPTLGETELADPVSGVPPLPSPAPGPSPLSAPVSCALEYLVNAGGYNTLIELIEGSSQSSEIAQILDSPSAAVTLLAPTDAGIPKTLSALGITEEELLADPALLTEILLYHILPSQIQGSDLVNGYSFNTELEVSGVAQSVAVNGSGAGATFVGKQSSAQGSGSIESTCNINIIAIDGILVP